MRHKVTAIYRGGVFIPRTPCDVPDGAEVELIIQDPSIYPPEVKTVEEQKYILRLVVQRMQHNPIPAEASRMDREALHERR
jgi:predicted DNA-binding antitoxin AbrB/MazE fold protein